jgi:import inner membrane translocase subunit TIM21
MNRSLRFSSLPRASRLPSTLSTPTSSIGRLPRWYATHSGLGGQGTASSSGPRRKQISVISDDGRLRWSELSGKEKVARATQQSFNFMIVVIGVVMTVGFAPVDIFYVAEFD